MSSILFHDASITYFTAEMAFVALSSGLQVSDIFKFRKKQNDLSYYGIIFFAIFMIERASERARWPCGWDPDPIFRIPSPCPVFS